MKLPVKLVWLKDPTQVSLGLLSLPTNVSLCTKWESNLHITKEMQALHLDLEIIAILPDLLLERKHK
ncbi:hypothetical protein Hanom_Chr10g00940521 [Helianthus anomalus]